MKKPLYLVIYWLSHARNTIPILLWLVDKYQDSDVLWIHMTRLDTMSSAGLLAKFFFGKKIVIDYHGITPFRTYTTKADKELSIYAEKIACNVLPYMDKIIVHSRYMNKEVYDKYGLDSTIIPLGVDLKLFQRVTGNDILKKYQLKNKKVILYVGRLSPHKRIDLLISAFILVQKEILNSILIIVGDGSERSNLEKIVNNNNLQDSIFFIGKCSDDDLLKFYSIACVFVTPSVHEGFCLPILESLACGTPVIGSNTTAISETLGDAGLVFKPNNTLDLATKIIEVLRNKNLREELIIKGYERVEDYSWDVTSEKIEKIFHEIYIDE